MKEIFESIYVLLTIFIKQEQGVTTITAVAQPGTAR